MKTINKKLIFGLILLSVFSCKNDQSEALQTEEKKVVESIVKDSAEQVKLREDSSVVSEIPKVWKTESLNDSLKKVYQNSGWKTLVDIQSFNPRIKIDLKYATSDNFMKMILYDTITKVYLQKDVAIRLGKCQEYLSGLNKNYFLLVYDGVRPVSVQYKMWKALDSIPVSQRVKFVSNPRNGSIHNYGAAVDLTICDQNGVALDMGARYDDIRKIAYPRLEQQFLASGQLTKQQVENRKMLRKVMLSQNFRNISTEWWHFNACTRRTAKAKYVPLK